MPCNISSGRTEPCKDSVGGLTKVYFVNFEDFVIGGVNYSTSSDEIATIDPADTTINAYQYDLKGTSSFEQTITSSRENGTTFYDQALNLTFKKLDKETHDEIALLVAGRPHVFVEDNNGNIFAAGLEYGMDVNGGTIVTGAAMGDMSGYTLTLQGMEKKPANFLASDLATTGLTVSTQQINP